MVLKKLKNWSILWKVWEQIIQNNCLNSHPLDFLLTFSDIFGSRYKTYVQHKYFIVPEDISGGKVRPVCKADNVTAICELIV
jgi:hypothetical protein